MNDKEAEAQYIEKHREAVIAGEALEIRARKLPIKDKLELLRRANAGENYKIVLEELESR